MTSVEDIVCTTAMRLKWQKSASDRLTHTLNTLRARLPFQVGNTRRNPKKPVRWYTEQLVNLWQGISGGSKVAIASTSPNQIALHSLQPSLNQENAQERREKQDWVYTGICSNGLSVESWASYSKGSMTPPSTSSCSKQIGNFAELSVRVTNKPSWLSSPAASLKPSATITVACLDSSEVWLRLGTDNVLVKTSETARSRGTWLQWRTSCGKIRRSNSGQSLQATSCGPVLAHFSGPNWDTPVSSHRTSSHQGPQWMKLVEQNAVRGSMRSWLDLETLAAELALLEMLQTCGMPTAMRARLLQLRSSSQVGEHVQTMSLTWTQKIRWRAPYVNMPSKGCGTPARDLNFFWTTLLNCAGASARP